MFTTYLVSFQRPVLDCDALSRAERIEVFQKHNNEFKDSVISFIKEAGLENQVSDISVGTLSYLTIHCTEEAIRVIAKFPGVMDCIENRELKINLPKPKP